MTLRARILLITALCWLLPILVLGVYMGGVFFASLQETTEAYLSERAGKAHDQARGEVERLIALSKDATYDGMLESAAAAYLRGELRYQDFFMRSRSYLNQRYLREKAAKFTLFFLMDRPGQALYTQGGGDGAAAFAQNALQRVLSMSGEMDTACRFVYEAGEIYLARNLYDRRLEPFGMLVICLDRDRLFAALETAGAELGGLDVALDEYRTERFSPEAQPPGLFDAGETLQFTRSDLERDYTLSSRFSMDKRVVYAQIDRYRLLMLILLLALLPVGLGIFFFAHRRITRPLYKLADASRRVASGEFGVTVPMKGGDEIGQAGKAFTAMSLKLHELIDKSYREELLLRDARIQALQSRVNPHFLNNALELINWQARIDGNEQIGSMVDALSTLLNASMDKQDSHLIPLSRELSIAEAYLYFLSLRFGDKLQVRTEVEEGLQEHLVPRLVIQTLLENAAEHGIAPGGGGHILLDVNRRGEELVIQVRNSGKTLTQKDAERIRQLIGQRDTGRSEHLGLRSIDQRLNLLYGDKARLSLALDTAGDTLAEISLPLHWMAEMDKNRQQST